MRKIALLAAATIGTGLLGTGLLGMTPAMAQPTLQFGIGPDGRPQVGVRDPQREEYERRERWRQRREAERDRAFEEGRRYGTYESRRYGTYESCRNITIEEQDRRGRTITRRIRRCD